jgi:anti-anti-sigma factor
MSNNVVIIRVRERRLVFPQVEAFAAAMKAQQLPGPANLILNLSDVSYLDSPAHGYLAELYRLVTQGGGRMKLVGLRPHVEAMAALVGLTRLVEVFPTKDLALGDSNSVVGFLPKYGDHDTQPQRLTSVTSTKEETSPREEHHMICDCGMLDALDRTVACGHRLTLFVLLDKHRPCE